MRPRLMLHMYFPVMAAVSALFTDVARATPVTIPITNGTLTASVNPLPTPAGVTTFVDLTGVTAPSGATLIGTGYTITFSNLSTCGIDEGIVQGTDACHAVPVAGENGTTPEYLTGGLGSALTLNLASSGNYLSTGGPGGQITITFKSPETSLELLWGSIDGCSVLGICTPASPAFPGNSLALNNGTTNVTTVTGYALETALQGAGFTTNADQGFGGSAWVTINTTTPFTSITLTSLNSSFESGGIGAASVPIDTAPEPASIFLVGTGLGLAALLRRSTLGNRLKR
jgi:hypothetical protein